MKNKSTTARAGRPPTNFKLFAIAAVVVLAFAAIILAFERLANAAMPRQTMPVLATLNGDVQATERSGKTVRVADLKGKVTACAYLYTVCPHGCATVTAQCKDC